MSFNVDAACPRLGEDKNLDEEITVQDRATFTIKVINSVANAYRNDFFAAHRGPLRRLSTTTNANQAKPFEL